MPSFECSACTRKMAGMMRDTWVRCAWRKSRHSNPNGACVEVGEAPGAVVVRDTVQRGQGPVLVIPGSAWSGLAARVRDGKAVRDA